MPLNIDREVALMERMVVSQLRDKFASVFGEPTRCRNKRWLIKRIAWRMQANEEGGLSERALRRAMELANDADLRLSAPRAGSIAAANFHSTEPVPETPPDTRLPKPGTLLTRKYKGRTLQVEVLASGFRFEGERYKSLTAVAKAVTGSHWNGFMFFGLKPQAAS